MTEGSRLLPQQGGIMDHVWHGVDHVSSLDQRPGVTSCLLVRKARIECFSLHALAKGRPEGAAVRVKGESGNTSDLRSGSVMRSWEETLSIVTENQVLKKVSFDLLACRTSYPPGIMAALSYSVHGTWVIFGNHKVPRMLACVPHPDSVIPSSFCSALWVASSWCLWTHMFSTHVEP